jgi:hypothetical protein
MAKEKRGSEDDELHQDPAEQDPKAAEELLAKTPVSINEPPGSDVLAGAEPKVRSQPDPSVQHHEPGESTETEPPDTELVEEELHRRTGKNPQHKK